MIDSLYPKVVLFIIPDERYKNKLVVSNYVVKLKVIEVILFLCCNKMEAELDSSVDALFLTDADKHSFFVYLLLSDSHNGSTRLLSLWK